MDSPTSQTTASSPMIMSPLQLSASYPGMDYDSTMLAMGILSGDVATVDFSVRHGASISERHQWTLYQACRVGSHMVKTLLASPEISSYICNPDNGRDSVLHFVLRTPSNRFDTNKTEVVELLVEHGADMFQPDRLGETALHILAGMPGEEDSRLLQAILAGSGPVPRLNEQNHYSDTALVVAVVCNNLEAARLLLNVGADPNIKGENGIMAAQYALQQGYREMLALLNGFGAEICEEIVMDAE